LDDKPDFKLRAVFLDIYSNITKKERRIFTKSFRSAFIPFPDQGRKQGAEKRR
jgi:hypothetical protein